MFFAVLLLFQSYPLEAAPRVMLNDKVIAFDVEPFIDVKTNRVMVPMRKIFEALGAEVEWDNQARSITARLAKDSVFLAIGSRTAFKYSEGEKPVTMELDAAPDIVGDRTMGPVRFVAESLGASVDWDKATQTVNIRRVSR